MNNQQPNLSNHNPNLKLNPTCKTGLIIALVIGIVYLVGTCISLIAGIIGLILVPNSNIAFNTTNNVGITAKQLLEIIFGVLLVFSFVSLIYLSITIHIARKAIKDPYKNKLVKATAILTIIYGIFTFYSLIGIGAIVAGVLILVNYNFVSNVPVNNFNAYPPQKSQSFFQNNNVNNRNNANNTSKVNNRSNNQSNLNK